MQAQAHHEHWSALLVLLGAHAAGCLACLLLARSCCCCYSHVPMAFFVAVLLAIPTQPAVGTDQRAAPFNAAVCGTACQC